MSDLTRERDSPTSFEHSATRNPRHVTFAMVFDAYHIETIVPLGLRGTFTYSVPEHLVDELEVGKRVVVPFGQKRFYTAIVYKLDVEVKAGTKPKPISYVMDEYPIVTDEQLEFWEWLSYYYMAGLGGVMNTALPNAMKLSSKSAVSIHPEFDEFTEFSEEERTVIAQLQGKKSILIEELERLLTKRMVQKTLKSLMQKGVVQTNEVLDNVVAPVQIAYVKLTEPMHDNQVLSEQLDALNRAPRQFELVMRFIEMSQQTGGTDSLVPKKLLLERANSSSTILKTLIEKGVFEEVYRLKDFQAGSEEQNYKLNEPQLEAISGIREAFKTKTTVLLHGVTGSGKTLVYADLIKQTVAEGKQVLYLVPEIALTTQLVERLKVLTGNELLVYHSRFSNRDRLSMWMQMLESASTEIVVGARSSLFLPYNNLGLIIVDEEHESSFKQHEQAPHYNARDAAIWLASKVGANVVLGSATPSVETRYLAQRGKFGLAELKNRFGSIQMPSIHLIDMTKSKRAEQVKSSFSGELVESIKQTLVEKKQVILFQNRRGYAPYLLCEDCGWNAECINCDVSLTYHKYHHKLLCHYCGHNMSQPTHCPQCHSAKLSVKGFGTEKIEDELELLFPNARIGRMDYDTTRKKNAFQNLITAFDDGSIDILVGTQMVTKGLDFANVGLVGVMNADSLWLRPDFRAFERAFQVLQQVSGRAGRKGKRGKVSIQTYRPEHPVLQQLIANDYNAMYSHQIAERQQFHYPPFTRMMKVQFTHPDPKLTKDAANYFASMLKKHLSKRVLGPEEPPIPRLRGRYIRNVFLKLEVNLSHKDTRAYIWQCIDAFEGHPEYRKVRFQMDVDPQ